MHLLYADETNLTPSNGEFFVYGGMAISPDKMASFHEKVEKVRQSSKVPADFKLKFNPGPEAFSHTEFISLKQSIIETAIEHECLMFMDIILHEVASSPDEARRFAINRVAYHFNGYLNSVDGHGLMLIDRFSDKQIDKHLRDKFSVGLRSMPYSEWIRLKRILGYHYSAIGQAHGPSVLDIVLGSFRFGVNAFTTKDEKKMKNGSLLLNMMAPMFERPHVSSKDFFVHFSPQKITNSSYRDRYDELKDYLRECGFKL